MIGYRDSKGLSFLDVDDRSGILYLADDLDNVGANFRQTSRNRDRIPCEVKQHSIEGDCRILHSQVPYDVRARVRAREQLAPSWDSEGVHSLYRDVEGHWSYLD